MSDDVNNLENIEAASAAANEELNAKKSENIMPNEAKTVKEASWHYAEDVPGTGEKPSWFLEDKYADVSRQAEAYVEANKKLGEFAGTPQDGYNLEKYKDTINKESPLVMKLLESSKALNMSQGGLEKILDIFVEYEKATVPDQEEFIKSLTPQETELAKNVFKWTQNNFTEEETETIAQWLTDKSALNILSKMRAFSRENRIPASNNNNAAYVPTKADVQSLIIKNYDQYKSDAAYRARLNRQMAQALEREGEV